ncbi:hypothetical protein PHLGIDRAFT_212844 [Phlebiopsis gigantea 11061_1 CR5-6]|uniref:Uncharacterized protein n=1 Tax=Phlebiopsis gigantea (strain 11061_1 CR5-6) TaxID=745531 RepID=A0A0C3NGX9_PHLG1|nr:hypothetical protein PHLGIDRAFT_212844 [Phlebiopsis gigantea 11061_1 CR5-6]
MTTCMRSGMRTSMARWTTNAANSFGPNTGATSTNDTRERSARQLLSNNNSSNSGPRELTAQQLAGSAADSLTEPAPAPRSRRSRRPNRRASQISTHSLPVYMKEPGEQEVIIYRGPEDMMEEPPTTAHVVMPSLAEGNESPDLSLETAHGQANVYAEMPDSPHDMPLLSSDESRADVDNSRAHLITPRRGGSARPSMETLATAEGANSPTVDPRGEAPAYFEVVRLDDLSAANTPEIPSPPSPEVPAQEPPENPRRRSGLFSLFHVRHHASRPQHLPAEASSSATHRRDASNVSNISTPSTIARPRSRAQSRAGTHRPSVSGSGFSILSRSRSRLLESPHLTSPSTISLHSISAPLTHTTTRSEFTYPRTGPTPEQIKLISSRESIARFGVPYGQDAIAFAASSSRMELPLHPPPDFEEFARPSGSPLVPSASPRISHDSAVDDVLDQDDTVHEADETAEEEAESASPTNDAADTSALPTLSVPVVAEGSDVSSARDSTTTISAPPGLGNAAPTAPAHVPPTAALRTRSPLQVHPRPESRASSFTSFATAEESLPPAASAATPYGSASSRLTLPKVLIPDTPAGTATPSSATASEPSTPRPATARLHAHEPTDATATPTSAATATPTSAATEVARAL